MEVEVARAASTFFLSACRSCDGGVAFRLATFSLPPSSSGRELSPESSTLVLQHENETSPEGEALPTLPRLAGTCSDLT